MRFEYYMGFEYCVGLEYCMGFEFMGYDTAWALSSWAMILHGL